MISFGIRNLLLLRHHSSVLRVTMNNMINTHLSHFMCQTVFGGHSQGGGVIINPCSILRMRVKGTKMPGRVKVRVQCLEH